MARSKVTSSFNVRLKVWMSDPSICALTPFGLMICPQS